MFSRMRLIQAVQYFQHERTGFHHAPCYCLQAKNNSGCILDLMSFEECCLFESSLESNLYSEFWGKPGFCWCFFFFIPLHLSGLSAFLLTAASPSRCELPSVSASVCVCRLRLGSRPAGVCQRVWRVAGKVHHRPGVRGQPGVGGGGGLRVHRYHITH